MKPMCPTARESFRAGSEKLVVKLSDSGIINGMVSVAALLATQVSICVPVQLQDSYVTFASGSFCIEIALSGTPLLAKKSTKLSKYVAKAA